MNKQPKSIPILVLIRGLPSSGKSSMAKMLQQSSLPNATVFETDQYFTALDGTYCWESTKLAIAHEDCQKRVYRHLDKGLDAIVANTFSQRWEMQPYLEMIDRVGGKLHVVDLFDSKCKDEVLAERNKHGVPVESIKAMRERYEHDWENASKVRITRTGERAT